MMGQGRRILQLFPFSHDGLNIERTLGWPLVSILLMMDQHRTLSLWLFVSILLMNASMFPFAHDGSRLFNTLVVCFCLLITSSIKDRTIHTVGACGWLIRFFHDQKLDYDDDDDDNGVVCAHFH